MIQRLPLGYKQLPLVATVSIFILMYGFGSFRYTGFLSSQVFLNLLIDNSFLIVLAVGMTFVIISGGIDLSVGSVIALTSMVAASLTMNANLSPLIVVPICLLVGSIIGGVQGSLIHFFNLQPFIVTLAGMFLARGLSYVISVETIAIDHPFFDFMANTRIPILGDSFITISVLIALIIVIIAVFIGHSTKFGRNVYAIGGSEQSANLMGLPVGRTKILIYTFSGFCASVGGLIFTFYMRSGYGLHANGMELDTIAAVVIGGTLLTGGAGYVAGSLFGVLILGIIQTIIVYEGTLSSWWTKIAIGVLLLLFIVLQRIIVIRSEKKQNSS
ncbi:galactofuranose ABC transporter, permease protein YjfF [Saliterribacillus persicus]|uniref:Monosaccharide ABC transporter membrane protein (CUT2 family) n=1 Tax=Saliterribacillus persicus TaxID=930114 RepID=A0A368Y502_9BACI|nr:galactofuranose ABC transporter, permease protein YjfF [Saliterribacillus persicus]RCW74819.1 monosaccharide ABC transporter membrane protein (CUT2 family) [Saliterribacillus persicus]